MPTDFWNQASVLGAPTQEVYKQLAREQHIPRGSTTAIALPQLMPGFMVGRCTLEGAPPGWRHDGIAAQINIDPDIAGEGFTVDMSAITPDAFSQATDQAQLRQAVSVDDLRNRASSVYRVLAGRQALAPPQGEETMPQPEGNMVAMGLSTAAQPSPHAALAATPRPVQVAPNPNTGQTKAATFAEPVVQTPAQPAPPAAPAAPAGQPAPARPVQASGHSLFDQLTAPQAVAPRTAHRADGSAPTYKITFEVKGAPMILESWWHDVIRNEHILVLVYDLICVGYPRSRLQPTDNDIAVHIDGSESIYLVKDPSIAFEFNNQEFQVLLIKAEHPYGAATAAVTE